MKQTRYSLSALVTLSLFLLTGCSQSSPVPTVTVTETVEAAQSEVIEPSSPSKVEVIEAPEWEDFLDGNLVELSVSKAECGFATDGSLDLLVTFKNTTDRKMLAISADVEVMDLFGERLIGVNISSDDSILAGASVNVGSWGSNCYSLNEYKSEDLRLLAMEDVSKTTEVVINVSKIAFEDGEVLEF